MSGDGATAHLVWRHTQWLALVQEVFDPMYA